jgi:hypothetical protein
MAGLLYFLIVFFMLGALAVLLLGIATLARGGNPQRSNKLMQYRVLFQALAVLAFLILMLVFRH